VFIYYLKCYEVHYKLTHFCRKLVRQVVTGYLPSVILVLFLCTVPPMMMLFSSVEGSISRSERKKSACCKVLYFTIWNVFFVNVFTGSVISQLSVFSSVTDLPAQLAKAVPSQVIYLSSYKNSLIFNLKLYLDLFSYVKVFLYYIVLEMIYMHLDILGILATLNNVHTCYLDSHLYPFVEEINK